MTEWVSDKTVTRDSYAFKKEVDQQMKMTPKIKTPQNENQSKYEGNPKKEDNLKKENNPKNEDNGLFFHQV